jgi:hypothetical protein
MKSVNAKEKCPKCDASYSVETLSAKRFINDISDWNQYKYKLIG